MSLPFSGMGYEVVDKIIGKVIKNEELSASAAERCF